jgi:large subunit ribosomal protein L22
MPGVKTNEVPGTRAVLRHYRMSASKARQVLDLIRGKDVDLAAELLRSTPREGARVVAKVLASAVANARNNDLLDPEDLFVASCYADEGATLKRWRPRARGRATRIRKRTCHITVIVSRLPEDRLERRRAKRATGTAAVRSRRVAASRRGGGDAATARGRSSTAVPESTATPVDSDDTDEDVPTAELVESVADDNVTDDVTDDVESGPDTDKGDDVESVTDTDVGDGVDPAPDVEIVAADGVEEVSEAKPRRLRSRRKAKAETPGDTAGSDDDAIGDTGADAEEED